MPLPNWLQGSKRWGSFHIRPAMRFLIADACSAREHHQCMSSNWVPSDFLSRDFGSTVVRKRYSSRIETRETESIHSQQSNCTRAFSRDGLRVLLRADLRTTAHIQDPYWSGLVAFSFPALWTRTVRCSCKSVARCRPKPLTSIWLLAAQQFCLVSGTWQEPLQAARETHSNNVLMHQFARKHQQSW
jgi:hypothetical protein